jgi:hypothetical protein
MVPPHSKPTTIIARLTQNFSVKRQRDINSVAGCGAGLGLAFSLATEHLLQFSLTVAFLVWRDPLQDGETQARIGR